MSWTPEYTKEVRTLLNDLKMPCQSTHVFEAAETNGGVEHHLLEQEGSAYSPLETAERCLASLKKMRA